MSVIEILEKSWEQYEYRIPTEMEQDAKVTYWELNTMIMFLFSDRMTNISPSFTSSPSLTWFMRFGETQSVYMELYLDDNTVYIEGLGMEYETSCDIKDVYDCLRKILPHIEIKPHALTAYLQ